MNERLDDLSRRIDQMSRTGPAADAPRLRARRSGAVSDLVGRYDRRLERSPTATTAAAGRPMCNCRPASTARSPRSRRASARSTASQPPPPARPQPQTPQQQPRRWRSRRIAAARLTQPGHAAARAAAPAAAPAPTRAPLPAQDLSGLEDQLRRITDQIETLRKPGVEEAINALRGELVEIGNALNEAMPRREIDAIEKQITGLTQRIAEGRQNGVDHDALAGIEHGLAEVRDALRGLTPAEQLVGFHEAIDGLAHKIDLIVAQKDPETMAQLENAINTLRSMTAHIASNETVSASPPRCRCWARRSTTSPTPPPAAMRSTISSIASPRSPTRWPSARRRAARCRRSSKRWCSRSATRSSRSSPRAATTWRWAIWKTASSIWSRSSTLPSPGWASWKRSSGAWAICWCISRICAPTSRARACAPTNSPAVDDLKHDIARTQNAVDSVHGTLALVVDRLAKIEADLRAGRAVVAEEAAPALPVGKLAVRAVSEPPPAPPQRRATAHAERAGPADAAAQPRPRRSRRRSRKPHLWSCMSRRSTRRLRYTAGTSTAAGAAAAAAAAADGELAADRSRPAARSAARARLRPAQIQRPHRRLGSSARRRRAGAGRHRRRQIELHRRRPPRRPGRAAAGPARAALPHSGPKKRIEAGERRSLPGKLMKRMKSLFVAASIIALVAGGVQIAGNKLDLGGTTTTQDRQDRQDRTPGDTASSRATRRRRRSASAPPDDDRQTAPPLAAPPAPPRRAAGLTSARPRPNSPPC